MWEAISYYLFGMLCPMCEEHRVYPWTKRMCPRFHGRPAEEIVHQVTKTIRKTIENEPADRRVHELHEVCDKLERTFPRKEAA
jgi:hypothetical protein